MSDIVQELLQARAEPKPDAKWPQWIAKALAYEPENPAAAMGSRPGAAPSEAGERRSIRVLTRVSCT